MSPSDHQTIHDRVTTLEEQVKLMRQVAGAIFTMLVSILAFAVIQTGTLLWFLSHDHAEQQQLLAIVADHETRIRGIELVKNSKP